MSEESARTTLEHIDHIITCHEQGRAPSSATDRWLKGIPDRKYDQFARAGLVSPRVRDGVKKNVGLIEWIDKYIADRADVKTGTTVTYQRARNSAKAFFGTAKRLSDVTQADAARFAEWLKKTGNRRDKKNGKKGLSQSTVRRTVGRMKQFFGAAIKQGYVQSDPFAELPSAVRENKDLFHFVEGSVIEDCLRVAPSTDWRTVLALGRYGGLRIPSELTRLRWKDVNFEKGRIVVRATKTEHHSQGGRRECPMFPELRRYLLEARKVAGPDAEYVIGNPRLRAAEANLRTGFLKIIKKAGHNPWPGLFVNLRKSRVTELVNAGYPLQSVAQWLGHSVGVLVRHYLMARDDDFQAAIEGVPTKKRSPRGDGGGDFGGHQVSTPDPQGYPAIRQKAAEITGNEAQRYLTDGHGDFRTVGDTELESVTSAV